MHDEPSASGRSISSHADQRGRGTATIFRIIVWARLVSEGDCWLNSRGLDLKASQWEGSRGQYGGDTFRGTEGADYPGGPRRAVPPRNVGRSGRYIDAIRVCPERPGNGASKELRLYRSRQPGRRTIRESDSRLQIRPGPNLGATR